MLDYGFFSDCFGPLLKVSSQYPCRFECIEVSEILFNYSLPHFKISFWFSGHSWDLLLKRRQGNLSTFNLKISLITW